MRGILKIVDHIYQAYAAGLMEDIMKGNMIWVRKMELVNIDFKMVESMMVNGKMEGKMGKEK